MEACVELQERKQIRHGGASQPMEAFWADREKHDYDSGMPFIFGFASVSKSEQALFAKQDIYGMHKEWCGWC